MIYLIQNFSTTHDIINKLNQLFDPYTTNINIYIYIYTISQKVFIKILHLYNFFESHSDPSRVQLANRY